MRSSRVFHAVDSHTEGMPTRVDHRRCRGHPRRDDERAAAALHRAPRPPPATADERAARARGDERRDPAAADPARLRLRRRLHRGVRLPADVRSRHDRRGDGARRDRHGRGRRAGHHDPARHAGRARRRATWQSATATPTRSPSRTCRASPSASTPPSASTGVRRGAVLDRVRRQLLRDRRPRRRRPAVRPRPRQHDILAAGLAIMDAINTTAPPEHPIIEGVDHVPPRRVHRAGVRRQRSRGTRWRSTRAGSTARPAAPGPRARMAELYARGELPLDTDFVNESFIGIRFIGRLVGETTVGGFAPCCPRSPAGPGSPAPPSICSTPPTRSRRDSNSEHNPPLR